MSVHLGYAALCWVICIAVTIWGLWPEKPSGNDAYGVGYLASTIFGGVVVIITWLGVWLIYFMIRDFTQLT